MSDMKKEERLKLQIAACKVRMGVIESTHGAKAGHPGGSLSAADMFTYLYNKEMRIDPTNPKWEDRDRFVLSKGHTAPGLYSALAYRGFFPVEDLPTLRHIDSYLQGHPNMNTVPGVDMSTGSLGQGISTACGLALGNRMLGRNDSYVYLVLGDGECDEGQVWEGAAFAAHHMLDHLIAFVDLNKQQLDGACEDVLDLGDMVDKFEAFGWFTRKVNGHDVDAILEAIEAGKAQSDRPVMIILDTIKGHGCLLAEETFPCHHMKFTPEQIAPSLEHAQAVLDAARKA